MDNAERTEILERIQLGQLQIRMYLDKAKQQCDNVDQLLNQLDAMTDEPVNNDARDSRQRYTPTYTGRKYGKHEFRQLRSNVVSES